MATPSSFPDRCRLDPCAVYSDAASGEPRAPAGGAALRRWLLDVVTVTGPNKCLIDAGNLNGSAGPALWTAGSARAAGSAPARSAGLPSPTGTPTSTDATSTRNGQPGCLRAFYVAQLTPPPGS